MNKKEFIESLGENPEDVIGMDWQNELQDIADNENKFEDMPTGFPNLSQSNKYYETM